MKIYEKQMPSAFNTIGDRILMVVEYDPTKLDAKKRYPLTIVRVFTNGTVRLQISAHVQETFNIRKIWPCKEQ